MATEFVDVRKAVECERNIGSPGAQYPAYAPGLFCQGARFTKLRIVLRKPPHDAAIGENDDSRSPGRIESDHDITMAGQIFGESGIIPDFERRAAAHNHDRVRLPLPGNVGTRGALGVNLRK